MKLLLLTVSFSVLFHFSFSQAGYIITEDDTLRKGFLRYQKNSENGQPEIELWKTKTDKHPKRYFIHQLQGYAIKSDTFKILKGFRYKKEIIEVLEVEVIVRGKLSLYSSDGLERSYGGGAWMPSASGMPAVGGTAGTPITIYILEDEKGLIQAIDRDHLEKDLPQFLFGNSELMSQLREGKIKYKRLGEVVRSYNKNSKWKLSREN